MPHSRDEKNSLFVDCASRLADAGNASSCLKTHKLLSQSGLKLTDINGEVNEAHLGVTGCLAKYMFKKKY